MIALFAPLPLFLNKLNLFQRKRIKWIPTFMTISIYLLYLYNKKPTSYVTVDIATYFVLSLIVMFSTAYFEKKKVCSIVPTLVLVQVGLYAYSENFFNIFSFLPIVWVVILSNKMTSSWSRLVHYLLPLLFFAILFWSDAFLNSPSYFSSLSLMTVNTKSITVYLVMTYLVQVLIIGEIIQHLRRFCDVGSIDSLFSIMVFFLFLSLFSKHLPEFKHFQDLFFLLVGTLTLFKKVGVRVRLILLTALSMLIIHPIPFCATIFLPLFSPGIVLRMKQAMEKKYDLRDLPLLLFAIGTTAVLATNLSFSGKSILCILLLSFTKDFLLISREKIGAEV